ncbi:MAG: hypothetical protein QNI91_14225 [Arenicellales bacterium]|nr:hypothetical protein [Arenicellales bacterium]
MQPDKRRTFIDETVTGAIGLAMVTVFLGFMALDIGDTPLIIVTLIVLALVFTDYVQTVKELRKQSENQETGE